MNRKFNKFIAILLCLIMTAASIAAAVPSGSTPLISESEESAPVISHTENTQEPDSETVLTEVNASEAPLLDEKNQIEQDMSEPSTEDIPQEPAPENTSHESAPENTSEQPSESLDEEAPVFDPEIAKTELLNCETLQEAEDFIEALSQEEISAVISLFPADELREFCISIGAYTEPAPYTFPIDYTNVGRLLPPLPKISTFAVNGSSQGPENGLITNKTAEKNTDGSYTITLETYTTGNVTAGEPIPVDVVLVLDESGSMADQLESSKRTPVYESELTIGSLYYVQEGIGYIPVEWCRECKAWTDGCIDFFGHWPGSKYTPKISPDDSDGTHTQFYIKEAGQSKSSILKSSAENFLNNIKADADKNNVEHKVSVIGFSGSGNTYTNLSDIRVENNYNAAVNAVRGLHTNGGTFVDDGLRLAATEFDNSPGAGRQRVVIVFTDGIPGTGRWNDRETQTSANSAISISNSLKNSYGATVYSIAMIADANPEASISGTSNTEKTNRFLHYISSNFPNAASMSSGGSGNQTAGYYLAANSQEALNRIFGAISQDIATPSIDLGAETIVKDVISPYFNAPDGTSSIKAYSAEYLAGGEWAEPTEITNQLTITNTDGTIDVSGFDYTENFVSENGRGEKDSFHGKKLIIKLEVNPREGFLGGNSVPTNESSSGVYNNGESLEFFPEPSVDVDIPQISITAQDKHVYLNSDLTGDELTNGLIVKCGSTVLNDPENPVEEWQKAFVTLGEPASSDISGIKADTKYTVNMSVTPKTYGSISGKQLSAGADIFVYKPEIICSDSNIFLGETADYNDNVHNEVKWLHGISYADPAKMTGPAPPISLSYNPAAGKFNADTDVKLAVEIKGEDVTNNAVIKNPDGKDQNHDFTVRVLSGTLKISKAGNAGANEGFIFTVSGPDSFKKEVSLTVGESLVLSGLPAGKYKVWENDIWAWKYDVSGSPMDVVIGSDSPNAEVTVTNTLKAEPAAENGDCFVRNISKTVPVTEG